MCQMWVVGGRAGEALFRLLPFAQSLKKQCHYTRVRLAKEELSFSSQRMKGPGGKSTTAKQHKGPTEVTQFS